MFLAATGMNFSVAVGGWGELVVSGVGVALGEQPRKERIIRLRMVVNAATRENVFSMEDVV
jgi:hypothetical protein